MKIQELEDHKKMLELKQKQEAPLELCKNILLRESTGQRDKELEEYNKRVADYNKGLDIKNAQRA